MAIDPSTDRLAVRQHERVQCSLRALAGPALQNLDQLRLVRQVCAAPGMVEVSVTDCSAGGIGLRSKVFFPKGAILQVRVPLDDGSGLSYEGSVRVQRVAMIGREPLYDLGTAFSDELSRTSSAGLMHRARGQTAGAPPGESRS